MALADRLNCSTAASRAQLGPAGTPDRALVVQCLRRVDVERLVEARRATVARPSDVWTASQFGPTLDGGVLPGSSVEQLINDACDNRLTTMTKTTNYVSVFFSRLGEIGINSAIVISV